LGRGRKPLGITEKAESELGYVSFTQEKLWAKTYHYQKERSHTCKERKGGKNRSKQGEKQSKKGKEGEWARQMVRPIGLRRYEIGPWRGGKNAS